MSGTVYTLGKTVNNYTFINTLNLWLFIHTLLSVNYQFQMQLIFVYDNPYEHTILFNSPMLTT